MYNAVYECDERVCMGGEGTQLRYPHAPLFTGCTLYKDYIIYNTIPTSHFFRHRRQSH